MTDLTAVRRKRGRPPQPPKTPEQVAARKEEALAYRRDAYTNITVDRDLKDGLDTFLDELTGKLGFRPTFSQAIRYLIANRKDIL